jgi:hypothetical protein
VTGRAGFLGSHLCERLLERGADLVYVHNFFNGAKRNNIIQAAAKAPVIGLSIVPQRETVGLVIDIAGTHWGYPSFFQNEPNLSVRPGHGPREEGLPSDVAYCRDAMDAATGADAPVLLTE